MKRTTINPKTGRKIIVGGPTYNSLVDEGIITPSYSRGRISINTEVGEGLALSNWEEEIRVLTSPAEMVAPDNIRISVYSTPTSTYSFILYSVDPSGFTREDLIYQIIEQLYEMGYDVDASNKKIMSINMIRVDSKAQYETYLQ